MKKRKKILILLIIFFLTSTFYPHDLKNKFFYKFKFFRSTNHKIFNENKGRLEGYKLSYLGNFIQNFLIKFFPNSFCNIYLAITEKK